MRYELEFDSSDEVSAVFNRTACVAYGGKVDGEVVRKKPKHLDRNRFAPTECMATSTAFHLAYVTI